MADTGFRVTRRAHCGLTVIFRHYLRDSSISVITANNLNDNEQMLCFEFVSQREQSVTNEAKESKGAMVRRVSFPLFFPRLTEEIKLSNIKSLKEMLEGMRGKICPHARVWCLSLYLAAGEQKSLSSFA
eukprot:2508757-Pleurochrysis_carterae.AAC.1